MPISYYKGELSVSLEQLLNLIQQIPYPKAHKAEVIIENLSGEDKCHVMSIRYDAEKNVLYISSKST